MTLVGPIACFTRISLDSFATATLSFHRAAQRQLYQFTLHEVPVHEVRVGAVRAPPTIVTCISSAGRNRTRSSSDTIKEREITVVRSGAKRAL